MPLLPSKVFNFCKIKVTDLDSLYSDGHVLLSIDIRTHIPLKHTDTVHQTHDGSITRIKSTEFDCFKNSINPTKIDEIKCLLENAESNCTGETINRIVKNIYDLSRESADIVKSNRKSMPSVSRKPNDKPWFGAQCKKARRNYFLSKRINRRLRTECLQISKEYKRVMNKHINKYKKSQQHALRHMQSSEPKKYWNFLNSLKSKQKADAPSVDTYYDFFKDVYSTEDDPDEVEIPLNYNFQNSNEDLNRRFTEGEINICIKKLKNSKSSGHDNILNEFIKITKVEMVPIYVSLFNIILKTGLIPDEWSTGKIRPIYKNKGPMTYPNHNSELSQ